MSTNALSLEYKVGVKREIINALRKVFGPTYPDANLADKIQVISEYPWKEVSYPMIIMQRKPGEIRNVGIGHYEMVFDGVRPAKLLHWKFKGTLTLEVFALSPLDRDMIITGLMNLLAFGREIPTFSDFHHDLMNGDFVDMQINTEVIEESGDGVAQVPWGTDEEPVFTDSVSVNLLGEFFTNPTTGGLIEIDRVVAYPYRYDQPVPEGSQAHDTEHDDRTVPWQS